MLMSDKSNRKIFPLAPKSDLNHTNPQYTVYEKYLDEAFKDCRIRNIALSGNLGSGKSSIIKSFDSHRNKREKFLYVSLADFTTKDKKTIASQQRLEYSLLCQILSRCRPSDIPASTLGSFPTKFRFLHFFTGIISLVCLTIFVLVFHEQFGRLAALWGVAPDLRAYIHLLLYAGLGAILFVVAFFLSKHVLSRNGLQKITLKTNLAEAELELGCPKTSLDEYKSDIVYALAQTGKRIDYTVVLEDLDRVEESIAVEIMEKLREINLLTNNYLITTTPFYKKWISCLRNKKTHIRFIYTVGEDVFGYDQRTKFYDYILPVIPTLNSCNSEYTIFHLLEECGVNPYPEKIHQFVRDIAPVLIDYRSLIAARNEYIFFEDIYCSNHKNRIDKLTLDEKTTLLAIVVYKTLFPRKYSEAFSARGQAMLERITKEDCLTADQNTVYGDLLVSTINKLFDSGILSPNSLRMVGMTNARIIDRWIRILDNGSHNEKVKLLTSLIESNYANDPNTQQEAHRFIKLIIDNKYLGKTQNRELSNTIAAFLSSSDKPDYKWFLNGFFWNIQTAPDDLQKQHFTNCIAYSAEGNHAPYITLSQKHGMKYLFKWCIWNLSGFADDELLQYAWTPKMAKELIRYLKYEPQSIPDVLLKKQITEKLTLGQLLQNELPFAAPIGR